MKHVSSGFKNALSLFVHWKRKEAIQSAGKSNQKIKS